MRRVVMVVLSVGLLVAASQPAWAMTTVSIVDFAFAQSPVRVAQGEGVRWHNDGTFTHTATQDGPLALWNTGKLAPGTTSASVPLLAAGTFAYHCNIHASMHGVVKVPIRVAPATGTAATTFTITLASAGQSGFTYDVQRRKGSGPWQIWKTGLGARTVTFSGMAGSYSFRSRLHRTSNGATSGWSPSRSITVA
jgi:plastocyanin